MWLLSIIFLIRRLYLDERINKNNHMIGKLPKVTTSHRVLNLSDRILLLSSICQRMLFALPIQIGSAAVLPIRNPVTSDREAIIAYVHFKMPFESSNLQGSGPIFPNWTLKAGGRSRFDRFDLDMAPYVGLDIASIFRAQMSGLGLGHIIVCCVLCYSSLCYMVVYSMILYRILYKPAPDRACSRVSVSASIGNNTYYCYYHYC